MLREERHAGRGNASSTRGCVEDPRHRRQTVSERLEGDRQRRTLLKRLEDAGIEVLVCNDGSMYAQQNLSMRKVAVVVVPSNKRSAVMTNIDVIAEAVKICALGTFQRLVFR